MDAEDMSPPLSDVEDSSPVQSAAEDSSSPQWFEFVTAILSLPTNSNDCGGLESSTADCGGLSLLFTTTRVLRSHLMNLYLLEKYIWEWNALVLWLKFRCSGWFHVPSMQNTILKSCNIYKYVKGFCIELLPRSHVALIRERWTLKS